MEYTPYDSSGTDDDLPQTGNGRSHPHSRFQNDMESQIHLLEQEAYFSVLRAFRAQADSISWEKNDLLTSFRRELRISDEEYSELKSRVDADDAVRKIREWRQAGGSQFVMHHNAPAYDSVVGPIASASLKRQKTSHLPSSALKTQPIAGPSSAALRGASLGAKGKKAKQGHSLTGVSTMKSLQMSSNIPSGAANSDPLIGRKVMTRWPEDNNFYEAEICDYREGRYALVYDKNTIKEAWEWVNFKEISPEDIKWVGENPGIFRTDLVPSSNGFGMKQTDNIQILNTEALVNEVKMVYAAAHPDPFEIEKMKKVLKEHEQSLIDVIARLTYASDDESEDPQGNKDNRSWNQHEAVFKENIVVS